MAGIKFLLTIGVSLWFVTHTPRGPLWSIQTEDQVQSWVWLLPESSTSSLDIKFLGLSFSTKQCSKVGGEITDICEWFSSCPIRDSGCLWYQILACGHHPSCSWLLLLITIHRPYVRSESSPAMDRKKQRAGAGYKSLWRECCLAWFQACLARSLHKVCLKHALWKAVLNAGNSVRVHEERTAGRSHHWHNRDRMF